MNPSVTVSNTGSNCQSRLVIRYFISYKSCSILKFQSDVFIIYQSSDTPFKPIPAVKFIARKRNLMFQFRFKNSAPNLEIPEIDFAKLSEIYSV